MLRPQQHGVQRDPRIVRPKRLAQPRPEPAAPPPLMLVHVLHHLHQQVAQVFGQGRLLLGGLRVPRGPRVEGGRAAFERAGVVAGVHVEAHEVLGSFQGEDVVAAQEAAGGQGADLVEEEGGLGGVQGA